MVLYYVDNVLAISVKPMKIIKVNKSVFKLKGENAEVSDMYLGALIHKVETLQVQHKENGRQTDLWGDQSRLKLFIYVHGVPGGENMGGNIPRYFLVQSKDNMSRQTSNQEERASN